MKIFSPVPSGSGVQIVHQNLANHLYDYKIKNYPPHLGYFPPLLLAYREKNADIVHAPIEYACFSKIKNKPMVSTVHGYMLDDEINNSSGFIRKAHYKTDLKYLIKKSLSMSAKVVCVSQYLKDKIIQDLNYQGDVTVIKNGIDTDKFRPANKDKCADKIKLLYVGNLRKAKGIDLLPPLLDLLGDRYVLLYTSGMKKTRHIIKHKNACCVGFIPNHEISELYNSADILICPSQREGFGLAIAEAMACGLPIVAANNSAIPELVIDNEGGFLCSENKIENYAEKIKCLAESQKMRNEMGEYNRIKIKKEFNIKRMVDSYKSLFEEVSNAD